MPDLIDERINRRWSVHALEYYSVKRKRILTCGSAQINPAAITLSEMASHKETNTV